MVKNGLRRGRDSLGLNNDVQVDMTPVWQGTSLTSSRNSEHRWKNQNCIVRIIEASPMTSPGRSIAHMR